MILYYVNQSLNIRDVHNYEVNSINCDIVSNLVFKGPQPETQAKSLWGPLSNSPINDMMLPVITTSIN